MFSTVRMGWAWWIPCQLVNFKMVPVHLQTSAVMAITFVWVIMLSIKYGLESTDGNNGNDDGSAKAEQAVLEDKQ